ncbi:MAG: hypothetical protein ACOC1F_01525 [Myxococcota bacterium]
MKWTKAIVVGAMGSLLMIGFMKLLIVLDFAPFNLPPSAAFLANFGLPPMPLGVIAHFLYGSLGSVLFVAAFPRGDIKRGCLFAGLLWLVMMTVYSPLMGWGIFGVAAPGSALAADHPLYLEASPKFVLTSLAMHLSYGVVLGVLNPRFRVLGIEPVPIERAGARG